MKSSVSQHENCMGLVLLIKVKKTHFGFPQVEFGSRQKSRFSNSHNLGAVNRAKKTAVVSAGTATGNPIQRGGQDTSYSF